MLPIKASVPAAALLATLLCGLPGCTPDLPEPQSNAARLYTNRCGTCHRLYPPNVMTAATWDAMLKRMQGEMRRRGFPPLTDEESTEVTAYLHRHALGAQPENK